MSKPYKSNAFEKGAMISTEGHCGILFKDLSKPDFSELQSLIADGSLEIRCPQLHRDFTIVSMKLIGPKEDSVICGIDFGFGMMVCNGGIFRIKQFDSETPDTDTP